MSKVRFAILATCIGTIASGCSGSNSGEPPGTGSGETGGSDDLDCRGQITVHEGDLKITDSANASTSCIREVTGSVVVEDTESLQDLSVLRSLETVGDSLLINRNAALKEVDALKDLTSVKRAITIEQNESLRSLTGLGSVEDVGILRMSANPMLAGLPPFGSRVDVGVSDDVGGWGPRALISIDDNPGIEDLEDWLGLTQITTQDDLPLEIELGGGVWSGHAGLTHIISISQTRVILRLRRIVGHTDLTIFAGFTPPVQSVSLHLDANADLLTLHGLEGLERLDTLELTSNGALESLAGFENLQQLNLLGVGGPCSAGNGSLTTLAGLDKLSRVDTLTIVGNASLSSLDGAPALTQAQTVVVASNPGLDGEAVRNWASSLGAQTLLECDNGGTSPPCDEFSEHERFADVFCPPS